MTVVCTFALRNPTLPAIVFILIYLLRSGFVVASVLLSYIGWILPKWFRRRIRQKTWIAKQIKSGKELGVNYITSKTLIHETKIVKEVSDQ